MGPVKKKRAYTWEERDTWLCKYCECTEYGDTEVNTGPHNLCEGTHCDRAYENYLDNFEDNTEETEGIEE